MEIIKKLICFSLFVTSFCILAKAILLPNFPDFWVYYPASNVFVHGLNPYIDNQTFFTSFVYPPFVLFIFLPFLIFPIFFAAKLWVLLSIVALVISLIILYPLFSISFFSNKGLIISSLIFFMFPVKFTLGMGQINVFILLFISLFLYFQNKQKNKLSGLFLGISIAIKLFPIALPFYYLVHKKWTSLGITVGTVVGIFFIVFILQPKLSLYFFQHLLLPTFNSWKGDYYNQALSGVIFRSPLPMMTKTYLKTFLSILLLAITFFMVFVKRASHKYLLISLLLLVNLLVNSFSWQHHFVWTIIPLLAVFSFLKKQKFSFWHYFILGVTYICIASNLKNPSAYPIIIQDHVFVGTFILWCFILYLLVKSNKHVSLLNTKI